jgi:hypothetical protein
VQKHHHRHAKPSIRQNMSTFAPGIVASALAAVPAAVSYSCSCGHCVHGDSFKVGAAHVCSAPDCQCGVQKNNPHCRSPTFQHFLARPYIVGLQDMLYQCSEPIHDFYHVEPQHDCLLNGFPQQLVTDWLLRYGAHSVCSCIGGCV